MISSLWIAKRALTPSKPIWTSLPTTANVSTNGFKRQRAVFEDLLYQTIRQPGHSLPNKPPYHPDYKSVRGTPGRHGTFTQPWQPVANQ